MDLLLRLRVRRLCDERNLKMEDLAKELGVTRMTLTRNLNGNPTLGTLKKIAEVLNVEAWELLTDSVSRNELIAVVRYRGNSYQADSLSELEGIVEKVRQEIKDEPLV